MSPAPRYILFGTPRFAAIVLEQLVAHGIPPVAVVANPDRPAGRQKIITPPPVKEVAARVGIPLLQPEKLFEARGELTALEAEVFVVASYGRIIPRAIFSVPPKGTVGVHPSLLPRHRGASPIQAAILGGDTTTGVSLFCIDEQVDHGPVLAQVDLMLNGSEIYLELETTLAHLGADLLQAELPRYLSDAVLPIEQNHAEATFTKKFSAPDAHITPEDLAMALHDTDGAVARQVDRVVRALTPEPGAWTIKDGKRMKILRTALDGTQLVLKEIQYEGRKPIVV